MSSRLSFDKQIEKIMNEFDWERQQERMEAMGWRWGRTHGVPAVADLKECARELLTDVVKAGDGHTVSTGGFQASREKGHLTLKFVTGEAYGYDII